MRIHVLTLVTAATFVISPVSAVHATPPAVAASAHSPATTHAALDQSSPKALLRSFLLSGGEVDASTFRSLLFAANPLEQKILDATVKVEVANRRLSAAERAKFGKATTRPGMASGGIELSEIDSFIEKIDGDHATVSAPKDPALSMQLVRMDGKWKLPIASLIGPIDPSMALTIDASTKVQVEIINGVAADVRDGKFKSPRQVQDELARRFAERLAAANHSSAQPPPKSQPAPGATSPKT